MQYLESYLLHFAVASLSLQQPYTYELHFSLTLLLGIAFTAYLFSKHITGIDCALPTATSITCFTLLPYDNIGEIFHMESCGLWDLNETFLHAAVHLWSTCSPDCIDHKQKTKLFLLVYYSLMFVGQRHV